MNREEKIVDAASFIKKTFRDALNLEIDLESRDYPDETIFIVQVPPEEKMNAIDLANRIDTLLAESGINGFVTVKSRTRVPVLLPKNGGATLQSDQTTDLIRLLLERSRTSEYSPTLEYIPDSETNISKVLTSRHHLIFGRRGAGKTSLLLQAKYLVEQEPVVTAWFNVQTYRNESYGRATLWIMNGLFERIRSFLRAKKPISTINEIMNKVSRQIEDTLGQKAPDEKSVLSLVPLLNQSLRRACDSIGSRVFVFLDDFHYFARRYQPYLLDMLHGCVRDTNVWLKIGAIKHLSRWFISDPPMGLQSGHDAVSIELDLSLQDPEKAKNFLERVLSTFASRAGLLSPSSLFAPDALDRLLLASGAVPRDYLELAANSLNKARERTSANKVGKQDVTKAAGEKGQLKITELQDDSSSGGENIDRLTTALTVLRDFCIKEKKYTFFRIHFVEKESSPDAYSIIQGLLEGRLIHLLNPSLSDEHHSGEKYEVYMLDLSQNSGDRLVQKIRTLEFSSGNLVLRIPGTKQEAIVGNTANKRLQILRRGPMFSLDHFPSSGGTDSV